MEPKDPSSPQTSAEGGAERNAGLAFSRERIADAWDEALPLLRANARETSILPREFDPDLDGILAAEAAGVLRAYTMRADGKLVGYTTFAVSPHFHFRGLIIATQDALFVSPEYRGRAALRFLRWQDDELAREGVDLIHRQVTVRRDYGRALDRIGYSPDACEWVRDLRAVPMCSGDWRDVLRDPKVLVQDLPPGSPDLLELMKQAVDQVPDGLMQGPIACVRLRPVPAEVVERELAGRGD